MLFFLFLFVIADDIKEKQKDVETACATIIQKTYGGEQCDADGGDTKPVLAIIQQMRFKKKEKLI